MPVSGAEQLNASAAHHAWPTLLRMVEVEHQVQAARQAARQYNAKVLSAQTVQEGQRRVHVIKLLTKDGVVKTVRIPVREG